MPSVLRLMIWMCSPTFSDIYQTVKPLSKHDGQSFLTSITPVCSAQFNSEVASNMFYSKCRFLLLQAYFSGVVALWWIHITPPLACRPISYYIYRLIGHPPYLVAYKKHHWHIDIETIGKLCLHYFHPHASVELSLSASLWNLEGLLSVLLQSN